MKNRLWFITVWLLTLCTQAQDQKQTLVVVHVDPAGGSQFTQRVMAYHFLNGYFTGTDELVTLQGRKDGKDYLRTDIGRNTLYNNRFLITGLGNIIDLVDKKVLFDGRAKLIRCSNDSAIFYTNDIFKGKFYSVFNFSKMEYAEVKALTFKAKAGNDVEFDKTGTPYKIIYYPTGAPKVILSNDAGVAQPGTALGQAPDPPLYWLDNTHFVHGQFSSDGKTISIYKTNVETKVVEALGTTSMSPEKRPAEIVAAGAGKLLLLLGQRQILIDPAAKNVSEQTYSNAGYGFSFECLSSSAGRVIKFNSAEVGKLHFNPSNFVTTTNAAALVKELSVGNETYQQGLAVWNGRDKKWINVEADNVLCLVGWINN